MHSELYYAIVLIVYLYSKKGIRMKKWQQGRSMIEMLGVLAIVGILSVAGLAGYLTAMNRYRVNQILDYVNRCALVARTYGDEGRIEQKTIYCGELLSDPAPNGLDGMEFVLSSDDAESPTYTIMTPDITSKDIRLGLISRATTTLNGEVIEIWEFQEKKIEFTFYK